MPQSFPAWPMQWISLPKELRQWRRHFRHNSSSCRPDAGDRSSLSAACLRLIYAPWSLMCTPSADRLNRSPSVVDTSLMTTPFSFFK
jgi:hypothetical protein